MPAKTWPRNTGPMIEYNRRRAAERRDREAREWLESRGYRVIEPAADDAVNPSAE